MNKELDDVFRVARERSESLPLAAKILQVLQSVGGAHVGDDLSLARMKIEALVNDEREACAKLCDDYARAAFSGPHGSDVAGVAAQNIAKAIRSRAWQ